MDFDEILIQIEDAPRFRKVVDMPEEVRRREEEVHAERVASHGEEKRMSKGLYDV